MRVWSYWEGPMPRYISTCLESMQCVLRDFVLTTPQNLQDYIPSDLLHPNYLQLKQPELRADCVRAVLLATHGGWWWDADTVALKDPELLHIRHPNASVLYCQWKKDPLRVLNGYIYFRPGSTTAQQWLALINRQLACDPADVSWCSLGEKLLTILVHGDSTAMLLDRSTCLPIDIDSDVELFFQPGDPEDYVTQNSICFGLNHSWFMYHKPREINLPLAAWLSSPLLIHRLLCSARGKS